MGHVDQFLNDLGGSGGLDRLGGFLPVPDGIRGAGWMLFFRAGAIGRARIQFGLGFAGRGGSGFLRPRPFDVQDQTFSGSAPVGDRVD